MLDHFPGGFSSAFGGGERMAGRGKVLVPWRCCRLGPKTDFSVGREAAESEVQLPWKTRGSEARSQVGDGDSLPLYSQSSTARPRESAGPRLFSSW